MDLELLWIELEMEMELIGVVTMVILTPQEESNLAMSTMGMMWPGAMTGNKNMWS